MIDDPQTSESAGSLEQTRKRVRVLAGDILGLAGPGKKISGIMPCTVIRPGDMAEQILDKSKHPEWNGERCKMLYQMPTNEELWNRYADLRADELREKGTFAAATEFYRQHREEMDAGAKVSWPGEAEDVAGEDADALPGLLHRSRRLARLRIVDDDELRADRATVGLLELHAANAARDARDPYEDAG